MAERADLVVLGGGLAGLSLAMRLVQSGYRGSVRIIEPRERYLDDRSWAFWLPDGALPAVPVTRTWDQWLFSRDGGEAVAREAEGWRYAYVRGSDFYRAALDLVSASAEVALILGTRAGAMKAVDDDVEISTDAGPLRTRHVVDTRPPSPGQRDGATLFQCFAGLELLLDGPGVDDRQVELMTDMRADAGGFVFSYVLPLTPNRVLVEATRFSRRPLPAHRLREDLAALLARRGWSGAERLRAEAAILPMGLPPAADASLPRGVVRAGTAAGALRAASGYGFLRIQAWADRCADAVMRGQPPLGHPAEPPLRSWMDGVFLRALASHPARTPDFFMGLANSVPAAAFVRFLSDQAGWRDHLRVMAALPPVPFLRALPARAGLPA